MLLVVQAPTAVEAAGILHRSARRSELLFLNYLAIIEEAPHIQLTGPLLPNVQQTGWLLNSSSAALLGFDYGNLLLLMPVAHDLLHKSKVFTQLLDRLDGRLKANPK